MSGAGIAGCLWVLAATIVALLPIRWQFAPGLVLLILAPVLIVWLALAYGLWMGAAALVAFLSMFRRPLIYLAKRALGQNPARPGREDGD